MSLFKFILSIISPKKSLDYFIESFEVSYNQHKKHFPGLNPHIYLCQAWTAFMGAKGENIDNQVIQETALSTTYHLACIPEPGCARALGLFMAHSERKQDFQKYPELELEFNDIFEPIIIAEKNDQLTELYKQYNPNQK